MPRTMLPNKNYRNIEKKNSPKREYFLNRVAPWIGRALYFGGLATMTYGGVQMTRDIDNGQKIFGIGAGITFVSAYALSNRKKLIAMNRNFEEDRKKDRLSVSGERCSGNR